jgi:MFS family permease
MMLLGIGAGVAFNPILLAAMSEVKPEESGIASGLVNTSFMMGGALGLAVLASIASARTGGLLLSGTSQLIALNSGYHFAFVAGAILAALGAILGTLLLRPTAGASGNTSP